MSSITVTVKAPVAGTVSWSKSVAWISEAKLIPSVFLYRRPGRRRRMVQLGLKA